MNSEIQQIAEWQRSRSVLSHDVLKNEVIQAVSKMEMVLAGQVVDDEFSDSFCGIVCPSILLLCAEVQHLAESAESRLTPKLYFSSTPLCGIDEKTKRWLPDLVHALWVNQSQLGARRDQVCRSAELVCQSVGDVSTKWGTHRGRSCALVKDLLVRLRQMAGDLAELGHLVPYHS